MKKLAARDYKDLLQVSIFVPCYMSHWQLLIVFHPSIWRSPWWASQQMHDEVTISDSRVACLGKTENAHWCHLRAPLFTHKGIWPSDVAISQLYLFTFPNCWTILWTCSLKMATPVCPGQDIHHTSIHPSYSIIIVKDEIIKSIDTQISFPWRLHANYTNVRLYWLLFNPTGKLSMPVILIQMLKFVVRVSLLTNL